MYALFVLIEKGERRPRIGDVEDLGGIRRDEPGLALVVEVNADGRLAVEAREVTHVSLLSDCGRRCGPRGLGGAQARIALLAQTAQPLGAGELGRDPHIEIEKDALLLLDRGEVAV